MTTRMGLARRLRDATFRRIYQQDRDPIQYRRDVGVCFVVVQLWNDGKHRVSSGVDNHEDKEPTSFSTADEMWEAIRAEELAAGEKMHGEKNKHYRAGLVESMLREDYKFLDTGDIALDELEKNPDRTWQEIAVVVAHRVGQP